MAQMTDEQKAEHKKTCIREIAALADKQKTALEVMAELDREFNVKVTELVKAHPQRCYKIAGILYTPRKHGEGFRFMSVDTNQADELAAE